MDTPLDIAKREIRESLKFSAIKACVLWYKKTVFQQLLTELAEIWPVPPLTAESQRSKYKSLSTLRRVHAWYFAVNIFGVWGYNLTPICKHYYRRYNGEESQIGTIWSSWYPFDKTQPVPHFFVYLFEILMGQVCVWITLSMDLLFSGMASHIVLLLHFLQSQLKSLTVLNKSEEEYHQEIVNCIKLHQRLIRYCFDIGEAFSFINLVNIVVSSINICCVFFTILVLDPFLAISNKLFLVSALLQVGMLCWYGQDIIHANSNISIAAYNSGWYEMTPRCRRALLLMIQRTQKPIGFTAMNFTYISLMTYTAIMTRAYSYFGLLYTLYNKNQGELACLYVTSITTPQVDQVVPLLHIVGYGTLGQSCVWAMIGSDLLFTGMVNHIILLLKILQQRLRNLGRTESSSEEDGKKLIECIKLHQRLIKYCKDLENAFSLVNLINICLSSVNICCVLFVIVLIEPALELSNKLFFGASLIQIGLLCWYGDDIIQENAKVAEAAYNSNWYTLRPRCRRILAILIQRAQQPIAFTAMGFTKISLITYSAILTKSYSYFTLLYTMYSQD
ncbi:odorant receptor 4-like [Pieris brassicae]|uniref:odorant receptor 4-like n=1 Tax=Pieris brassicae TaxID=7116 RepID=UPI001E662445|nr:odorant receptor 4-like [Pieris brassicae]